MFGLVMLATTLSTRHHHAAVLTGQAWAGTGGVLKGQAGTSWMSTGQMQLAVLWSVCDCTTIKEDYRAHAHTLAPAFSTSQSDRHGPRARPGLERWLEHGPSYWVIGVRCTSITACYSPCRGASKLFGDCHDSLLVSPEGLWLSCSVTAFTARLRCQVAKCLHNIRFRTQCKTARVSASPSVAPS